MKKLFKIILIIISVLVALAVVFFIVLLFIGSGGGNSSINSPVSEKIAYDTAGVSTQSFSAPPAPGEASMDFRSSNMEEDASLDMAQERLIIRTGELSMIVSDVREAVKAISEYAVSKGGFVVSSSVSKSDLFLYGEVSVRIPVEEFDKGIADFKAMGEVQSENAWGQDVTEEFVDLDAQLGNLEATEKQFLLIMERAQKIEDILAVQRELTWVRRDIERIEGRMKYLQESADLSTLTVYLSTDPSVLPVVDNEETWKPFAVVKNALRSLIDFSKGLVNVLIWVVVFIPVLLIFGFVIWGVVKLIKKFF